MLFLSYTFHPFWAGIAGSPTTYFVSKFDFAEFGKVQKVGLCRHVKLFFHQPSYLRLFFYSTVNQISWQIELNMSEKSEIREFYTGKNFFITGGTGFVGLCLIERILRSIPDSGKLYLLMRPKKGKDISERLQEFPKNPVSAKYLYSTFILITQMQKYDVYVYYS